MFHFKRRGNRAQAAIVGNLGDKRSRTAGDVIKFANIALTAQSGGLSLYQPIDEMFGTTAAQFSRELAELGDVDSIDLYLSSPGGDVFDSLAIHSMLVRHPARVSVHVDLAASAASFIAMAGDDVDIVPSGRFMIHNAQAIVGGDHNDLRAVADVLESLSGTIANLYSARTGRAQSTFLRLMEEETWLDAQQSVACGLADSITPQPARGSTRQAVQARLRQLAADDHAHRFSPGTIAARVREVSRYA